MNPLSSLDGIVEILRNKVSAKNANKSSLKEVKHSSRSDKGHHNSNRLSAEALQQKIVSMIKVIDRDDPKRKQKATRIFVENILVWQFGEELLNDPKFSELVNEVGSVLDSEPQIIDPLLRM